MRRRGSKGMEPRGWASFREQSLSFCPLYSFAPALQLNPRYRSVLFEFRGNPSRPFRPKRIGCDARRGRIPRSSFRRHPDAGLRRAFRTQRAAAARQPPLSRNTAHARRCRITNTEMTRRVRSKGFDEDIRDRRQVTRANLAGRPHGIGAAGAPLSARQTPCRVQRIVMQRDCEGKSRAY